MKISAKELNIKLLLHSSEYYSRKEVEYMMFMNPNKMLNFTAMILSGFSITSIFTPLGLFPRGTQTMDSTAMYNSGDIVPVVVNTSESFVLFSDPFQSELANMSVTFEEYGRLFIFIRQ